MKIAYNTIVDPRSNTIYVVPALIITFFACAYSLVFGPIVVLAFYGCWMPLLFIKPEILVHGFVRVAPLLVLPALAALSTLWSDVPSVTLRAAIQFSITVVSGLIAARLTSIPNLSLAGMIGGFIILLYSFSAGTYSYDVVDGSYAFAGAFGSKNQLGYYASLTIIFSLAVAFIFHANLLWRLLAFSAIAVAALALSMTESATSVLTLLLGLIVIFAATGIAMMPRVLRGGIILIVFCMVLVLLGVAVQLDLFEAVFAAFGKDTTLTGRTYLWNQGIEFGRNNLIWGLGYDAFWTHGRPEAEDLWREFYIGGRAGFHFHNTLIEAFVALGLIGVAVVGAITLALFVMPFLVIFNREQIGSAIICSGLAMMYIPRSFVEIDYLSPHTAGAFLVPFLLLHMMDQRSAERERRQKSSSWRSLEADGLAAPPIN